MPLRVVLAEDSYLVREGTAALIAEVPELTLVGSAVDLPSLLLLVDEHEPDAVLTDIKMPPSHSMEGIEGTHSIKAKHPGIGVVVLSQHADPQYAVELFKHGAEGVGYLLKERIADVDDLLTALKTVAAGGSVLDPRLVEGFVLAKSARSDSALDTLSERESSVLAAMAQGRTNSAIARELFLSERAVEKHINTLFTKLGLTDTKDFNRRVLAVLAFLREGGPA